MPNHYKGYQRINQFTKFIYLYIGLPNKNVLELLHAIIYQSTKFPCVEGFVDGTHVRIIKPHIHEQVYVNRKDFHFFNVQICGNGEMTIIDVVAKCMRSSRSKFYHIFQME
jgi:hypothetical protein